MKLISAQKIGIILITVVFGKIRIIKDCPLSITGIQDIEEFAEVAGSGIKGIRRRTPLPPFRKVVFRRRLNHLIAADLFVGPIITPLYSFIAEHRRLNKPRILVRCKLWAGQKEYNFVAPYKYSTYAEPELGLKRK